MFDWASCAQYTRHAAPETHMWDIKQETGKAGISMDMVNVLKALSDETRLRIVNLLYEREMCVCDIMESLRIPQTKASRHLAVLKSSGVVSDRKSAQWVYYSIVKDDTLSFIDSIVSQSLRETDTYMEDLKSLEEWLKRKGVNC
jgi:ArsR family transcriptional regulator, arsenate/arsenite/antimonite-responsive transcriptional repressor